ncbi:hypothetical protein ACFLSA_00665, partial [Bacteroidota bacterium]
FIISCSDDDDGKTPKNPDKAEKVSVDRFSDAAATLMKRSTNQDLPGVNMPISYDVAPFITKGLGPGGEHIEYYNFDVQPTIPAPIYVLISESTGEPVTDQLNIVDVVPGDVGYNDFWQVYKVTVPVDYEANTITSYSEIMEEGFSIESASTIVNCPVVPEGSTASKRYLTSESTALTRGWYKGKVAYYFNFSEALLQTVNNSVPVSPIFVMFNVNPDNTNPNSGPPSGFKTETGNDQTHNVVATIPGDQLYSPLWSVNVYNNSQFDNVSNLTSISNDEILAANVMTVNCPIVSIE